MGSQRRVMAAKGYLRVVREIVDISFRRDSIQAYVYSLSLPRQF